MNATAKKMLSVLLAFVLVFTLTPTVAFGGNEGEGEDGTGTEDTALLTNSTEEESAGTDMLPVSDTLVPEDEPEGNGTEDEGDLQLDDEAFVKEVVILDENEEGDAGDEILVNEPARKAGSELEGDSCHRRPDRPDGNAAHRGCSRLLHNAACPQPRQATLARMSRLLVQPSSDSFQPAPRPETFALGKCLTVRSPQPTGP